jgi:hypothetical protein
MMIMMNDDDTDDNNDYNASCQTHRHRDTTEEGADRSIFCSR